MTKLAVSAPPESGGVRIPDVCSSLADELERARVLGLRVEGAICTIAVRSSIDTSLVAELQQLDAMLQHIAALRDFVARLALDASTHHVVDVSAALERITLADVRARLGGSDDDVPDEQWEML